MTVKERLKDAQRNGYALLATNFYNYETLVGIVIAAAEQKSPVILQLTKSSIDYMGLHVAVNMARTALRSYQVEGYLHLDHADSIALVQQCLDAGFDSVMIDASEQPMTQNIALTSAVVRLAETYRASVEAELGYVPKLGQSRETLALTEPNEAAFFAKQTGIDSLAVAIGNSHGFYIQKPQINLDRLAQIRAATPVPLVLHGSSGIATKTLQETVKRGICKVNLATEIKNTFMKCLQDDLVDNTNIDLRTAFPPAIQAVSALVSDKLKTVGHRTLAYHLKHAKKDYVG
jgi:tagatose 1,6-diphosphate aldolase GatY/KbaY